MQSIRDLSLMNGNGLIYPKSQHYPVRPNPNNTMALATDMYSGGGPQMLNQGFHHSLHHHSMINPHTHMHYSNSVPVMHQHDSYAEAHNPSFNRVWDIWASNFREGMNLLRTLTRKSKYVAVDTEFPGVVAKLFGDYPNAFEQSYHNVKVNIDMLKPIQIGFSFFNDRGVSVENVATIQFNMRWNVDNETYATDSITLLEMSGINFEKLKQDGIPMQDFAEVFISSGLAVNDDLIWIGFHSVYDFAYMMKVCTDWDEMPHKFIDFQKLLVIYFPKIIDLKALASEYKLAKLGLTDLASALKVQRNGHQHQAGSDAMLTGETFFRFLEEYAQGQLDNNMLNFVYGLNYGVNSQPFSLSLFGHIQSDSEAALNDRGGKTATHSADQSGRNSPADSTSGHKSS